MQTLETRGTSVCKRVSKHGNGFEGPDRRSTDVLTLVIELLLHNAPRWSSSVRYSTPFVQHLGLVWNVTSMLWCLLRSVVVNSTTAICNILCRYKNNLQNPPVSKRPPAEISIIQRPLKKL